MLMGGQIVQDHHLTRTQGGHQYFLHKGQEHVPIRCGRDRHPGLHPFGRKGSYNGEHFPVTLRHRFPHALAFRRSSA